MTPSLPAGTVVGGYVIDAPLGRGGMATVYRAQHPAQPAPVALKVLAPELSETPVQIERFLREARACSALRHEGIVAVYASGRDAGRPWMAMELLEGEALSARLARGPMAPLEALSVLRATLRALAFAHERDVLHRDVKPANVFVTRAGEVKLLDFGIARLGDAETLTATGQVLGTATHLAPELCRGERATPASDLYALGVTLFELLTGRLPFTGNAFMLVVQHAKAAPPKARSIVAAVPPSLEALADRLLAKDIAVRPGSASALLDELEVLRAELDPGASTGASGELHGAAAPGSASARLMHALATLERDAAEQGRVLAGLEHSARAARAEAAQALHELGQRAGSWLGGHGVTEDIVLASEQRWSAARARVSERDAAWQQARRAVDDLRFQIDQVRGRLAMERA